MKALMRFTDVVDHVSEWCGKIFSFIIVLMMIVLVYDVFMRYFLNKPTSWGMELTTFFQAGVLFLGGGYSLLHGGHVKVDIAYSRWSARKKAIVDLITYLFLFALSVVLVWYGGKTAWASLIQHKVSTSAWSPPLWPIYFLVPVGGFLLGLQCLVKWMRDLVTAITGKNLLESRVVSGEGGLRG